MSDFLAIKHLKEKNSKKPVKGKQQQNKLEFCIHFSNIFLKKITEICNEIHYYSVKNRIKSFERYDLLYLNITFHIKFYKPILNF